MDPPLQEQIKIFNEKKHISNTLGFGKKHDKYVS